MRRPAPAYVLAVFSRHIYVQIEEIGLLALAHAEEAQGPFVATLRQWPISTIAGRTEGRLEEQCLDLDELRIDLSAAEIWPSAIPDLGATAQQPRHLDRLIRTAAQSTSQSELLGAVSSHPDVEVLAGCNLSGMAKGLRSGDANAGRSGAEQLAGLGTGLTPSGDDFLCGMCTALHCFHPAPKAISTAIVNAASGRTTSLSVAFIDAAASGHVNLAWMRFLRAYSQEQVDMQLDEVLALGHSSGGDMLAGFIWTARNLLA